MINSAGAVCILLVNTALGSNRSKHHPYRFLKNTCFQKPLSEAVLELFQKWLE